MNLQKKCFEKVSEFQINGVIETFKRIISQSTHKQAHSFHRFVNEVSEEIINSKKIPHIKNIFSFVLSELPSDLKKSKDLIVRKCNIAQMIIKQNSDKITGQIYSKIKNNSKIIVHGFCPELISAIKNAKKDGLNLSVFITDSPFSEVGKEYHNQLLKFGVSLNFYPFAALRQALKKADFAILPSEAVSYDKIITDMGGELIAESAFKKNIPFFVVASSLNFHREFDISLLDNLKKDALKGTHSFYMHNFEQIDPYLVSGIISEKGTQKHALFVESVLRDRKFLNKQ